MSAPASSIKFPRLAGWLLALTLTATTACAYTFITDSSGIYVITWKPGTVPMNLKMPAPPTPLTDGTDYNTSVQAAMQAWNGLIGTVQFTSQIQSSTSYTNGNRINEIVMDSKMGGQAFGSNVLAVTLSYTSGNSRTEADIVFNTAYSWDSFRGPLSSRAGKLDIQRVAIHELGHVLGLDHPDQASPPQAVSAIMNSRISSIDTMTADDIAGAQILYGAPGFVPANNDFASAIAINLGGNTAQLTGSNVGATKESAEPAHAGGPGAHSIWWKWTAPSGGNTTITTLGSDFDTALAIYTGSAVGALTSVASNDDVTRGVIRTSSVNFTAASGTTYYIAVDGWDSFDMGAVTLNLVFDGAVAVAPPIITSQPASQTTTPGGGATFSVTADNAASYQWKLAGVAVAGGTAATLTLSNVQAANAGSYAVTVSNSAGAVTSNAATLTVLANPVVSQIATTGHDVAFSATGTGNGIKWQVSSDSGTTWTDLVNNGTYSGVATSTLTITGATAALNGYKYRFVSSSNGGSAASNAATLSVTQAFFPFPVSLDLDSTGNLYVADTGNDTIQKISTTSEVTLLAGTSGQTGTADGAGAAARFNDPSGVAVAGDGTLSVSDNANGTIRRITTAAAVTTLAGSTTLRGNTDGTGTAATFSSPLGLVLDAGGNLFVADATNNTIRKITSAGAVTTYAGGAGVTGSADGAAAAARFNHPTGVAVDGSGNLYVSDTTNNTIRKITAAGAVTTLAGLAGVSGAQDGTGAAALFNRPTGLIVDAAGNLYVADTGNSIIRRVAAAGGVTTYAGLSGVAGLKDGTGNDAWFNQPQDLALDSAGNLYVADTGNATIRKVSPGGVVTTLLLTAGSTSSGGTSGGGTSGGTGGTTVTGTGSSGGGGGGGALDSWLAAALGLICLVRWSLKRN